MNRAEAREIAERIDTMAFDGDRLEGRLPRVDPHVRSRPVTEAGEGAREHALEVRGKGAPVTNDQDTARQSLERAVEMIEALAMHMSLTASELERRTKSKSAAKQYIESGMLTSRAKSLRQVSDSAYCEADLIRRGWDRTTRVEEAIAIVLAEEDKAGNLVPKKKGRVKP